MSGSVFLSNLDDFIVPSQACVNPYVAPKINVTTPPHISRSKKHSRVTLETDFTIGDFSAAPAPIVEPNLIKQRMVDDRKVATVSINDCLACSGCVTSAEAILIQEQSSAKFQRLLRDKEEKDLIIVVQISPNSRASIAEFLGLHPNELFLRLSTILKSHGVKYVVDSSSGADIALVESREEFLYRYKQGMSTVWNKPPATTAVSSTAIHKYLESSSSTPEAPVLQDVAPEPELRSHLPIFTSNCPGWICYAEKTTPQVLPYISTVKSPQQIIGTLIKYFLSLPKLPELGSFSDTLMECTTNQFSSLTMEEQSYLGDSLPASKKDRKSTLPLAKNVIMVSIQPCFDKKLEASRKDFYHTESTSAEVDLVLSTTELWQILESFATAWHTEQQNKLKSSKMLIDPSSIDFDIQEEDEEDNEDDDEDEEEDDDEECNNNQRFRSIDVTTKTTSGQAQTVPVTSTSSSTTEDCNSTSNNVKCRSKRSRTISPTTSTDDHTGHPATTSFLTHRLESIKQNFHYIYDYLYSIEPDALLGDDQLEAMFRSFSATGEQIYMVSEQNTSSGGYVEYLFKSLAERLYQVNLWSETLIYTPGRNPDMTELDLSTILTNQPSLHSTYTSSLPAEQISLRFARAYGFRNIQSILLKMKRGKNVYHYVEIMACPSGCTNGGGQLKTLSSIIPLSTHTTTITTADKASQQEDSKSIKGDIMCPGKEGLPTTIDYLDTASTNANTTIPGSTHSTTPSRVETPAESKERIAAVETYFHRYIQQRKPEDSPLVQYLYNRTSATSAVEKTSSDEQQKKKVVESSTEDKPLDNNSVAVEEGGEGVVEKKNGEEEEVVPLNNTALQLLHTRYHAVPKLENIAPLAAKW